MKTFPPETQRDPGAPSAGGAETNSVDAGNAPVQTAFAIEGGGGTDAESTAPAHPSPSLNPNPNPNPKDLRQPIISFTCAYWDWLRGEISEPPKAAEYELEERFAEVLRRQCNNNRNQQLYVKALKLAALQEPSVKGAR